MKRIVVALGLGLTLGALTATVALADGGPHGRYGQLFNDTQTAGDTDKCAACHRVHQGKSAGFLLKKATAYQLCVTCHDGSVSKLDVLDGKKLATATPRPTSTPPYAADDASVLNGGGFEYVNGVAVTSLHNVFRGTTADGGGFNDTEEKQPWGYLTQTGQQQSTTELSQALTCSSCHNPHGSANYRMLMERVNSNVVSVLPYKTGGLPTVWDKDEGAPGLESGIWTDKYTKENYGGAGLDTSGGYRGGAGTTTNPIVSVTSAGNTSTNGFALLCGSCHTAYASSKANVSLTGGSPSTTNYRHRTEMSYKAWTTSPKYGGTVPCNPEEDPYNIGTTAAPFCSGTALPKLRLASNGSVTNEIVTCLTCHRAHGTSTSMTGWALTSLNSMGGLSPDSISPAQQADTRVSSNKSTSTLLFTNNRAMCEACHQW